jgi:uncharacterized protein (TIRG00374 family)
LTTTAEPGAAPRRRLLVTVIGIVVTILLLYWVFRGTSLSDVLRHLREARPLPLLAGVVLATAGYLLRAIRWRVLLRMPDGAAVAWPAIWHATAMGFMANNTLPFRLGEVLRSYAASRLGGVPIAAAFSSIAVERALDGLTLLALLGVALFGAGLPAETEIRGVRLDAVAEKAAVICAVIFAGALFVVLFPRTSERLIRLLVPFKRVAESLVRLVEGVRLGFGALRSPVRLVAAAGWSVAFWLLNAAGFWVAFAAFGIDVGFVGALLVQSLLAFGIAAQLTPGFFGQFEFLVAGALSLFGVPNDVGLAYALTYHVTTFFPIVFLGLWSFHRTGLHLKDARAAAR